MDYFFVTSGINCPYGLISATERLNQTIGTIKSIKEKRPDAVIMILEGGKEPLSIDQRRKLDGYVIDFTSHPTIRFAHMQNVNSLYVKGPCESLMIAEALLLVDTKEGDRIFKITGRQMLSDQFDYSKHDVKGKYVFKTKDGGVKYYGGDINWIFTEFQYKTRLYSICGSLLDQAREDFANIHRNIIDCYSHNSFIDIEHATYRTLKPELVHEIAPVGLTGIQAENNEVITE